MSAFKNGGDQAMDKEVGTAIQKEVARADFPATSKEPGASVRPPSYASSDHAREGGDATTPTPTSAPEPIDPDNSSPKRFAYFRTSAFWLVLLLGQILALCITGTNTLTTLLVIQGTSIPAFQSLFTYVLLNIVYTGYTLYRYGLAGWVSMIRTRGWKFLILGFCDVQGSYFTVLAYRYTTILSAQLINFWAIVVVVAVSFFVLKVRYHWAQIVGILVCIGGMGILLGSDHINGINGGDISKGNQLKGDLFALVGATFYGLSNIAQEYLVSQQPLYEVVGQIGWWGTIIIGVQAAIFDRSSFATATWNGKVGGYLTGYTLILSSFYTIAPIVYRLASAAFFNISLLTANFWGVIIGVKVFGYRVHFMYPIAFVLIILGQCVYYLGKGTFGEAKKVWLGEDQANGVAGIGTAKRRMARQGEDEITGSV